MQPQGFSQLVSIYISSEPPAPPPHPFLSRGQGQEEYRLGFFMSKESGTDLRGGGERFLVRKKAGAGGGGRQGVGWGCGVYGEGVGWGDLMRKRRMGWIACWVSCAGELRPCPGKDLLPSISRLQRTSQYLHYPLARVYLYRPLPVPSTSPRRSALPPPLLRLTPFSASSPARRVLSHQPAQRPPVDDDS